MDRGAETFFWGWRSNETAKFTFYSINLEEAPFDFVHLASLDLTDGTFTQYQNTPTGLPGKDLYVRIDEQGTPATPVVTLQISYDTDVSVGVIDAGLPTLIQPLGEQAYDIPAITSITAATFETSPLSTPIDGVLDFYTPTALIENFEDNWSAATLGL